MREIIKNDLVEIQKKIQVLKSDSRYSGVLQKLLNDAGGFIGLSDEEAGARILEYRDELYFYSDGGDDNLEKFYKCKAESLSIIAKKINP